MNMLRTISSKAVLGASSGAVRRAQPASFRCFSIQVSEKSLKNGGFVAHLSFTGSKKYAVAASDSMEALGAEITTRSREEKIKAIFLRSVFAGADLNILKSIDGPTAARDFILLVDKLCSLIQNCTVPVIQVIDGPCLGAGMEVSAACDMRIAVDGSIFGMPETKLGMPSPAQAALFPGLIGYGRARELLYWGETYQTQTMFDWGFLNARFPRPELDSKIEQWEEKVNSVGTQALRLQKALMRDWEEKGTGRAGIEAGEYVFANAFKGSEPAEMLQRFLDARSKKKT